MELTTQDESAIHTILDDYMKLWMDGDAQACADLYTPDGDGLGVDGTFLRGREAIARYYATVMSGKYAGLVVRRLEATGLRAFGPGVALLDAKWEVGPSGEESGTQVMATFVVTNSGGTWKIAAARLMVPANVGAE